MTPGPIRTSSERLRRYTKSERTHEENQERAYIAASRRSDRSLEARMESARRASEIHKRRCGRGFRITEEAVLNEEMYEEEDPDYGHRIQRLYSALSNDPAVLQQQWLRTQWLLLGQNNSKVIPGSTLPQHVNSPQSTESIPFFAYQPGPQPTSTPIRSSQDQRTPSLRTSNLTTSTGIEDVALVQSPDTMVTPSAFKLNPQTANHPYMRSQSTSGEDQSMSSNTSASQMLSPSISTPLMGYAGQNTFDMNDMGPPPYPAQLNLFTYPTNSPILDDLNHSSNQLMSNSIDSISEASQSTANLTQLSQFFPPQTKSEQDQHQPLYTGGHEFVSMTASPQDLTSRNPPIFSTESTQQRFRNTQPMSDTLVPLNNDSNSWEDDTYDQGTGDPDLKGVVYDDWLSFPLGSQGG